MRIDITGTKVAELSPTNHRYVAWDAKLTGFGVKVETSGVKSFIFRYRASGIQRTFTIGRDGNLGAKAARIIAEQLSAEVAAGGDPARDKTEAREAPLIRELWDKYWNEHAVLRKKERSAKNDDSLWRHYIGPKFANMRVSAVSRGDISSFHSALGKESQANANRSHALLSKMFNLAKDWGMFEGDNPCERIKKFKEEKRERYLSEGETARLFATLNRADAEGWFKKTPDVTALFRLLLLTGARLREIMNAEWEWVDCERRILRLPDSKTGKKNLILSEAAFAVLDRMPREGRFIIRGADKERPLNNPNRAWSRLLKEAEITDLRRHDLRHSFASSLVAQGVSLPIIGKLLGHSQPQTTARYAHLADDPLREAANLAGAVLKQRKAGVSPG